MAGTIAEGFAEAGIAPPRERDHGGRLPRMVEEKTTARASREKAEGLLGGGLITGQIVGLSRHAVERYQQRFEPTVDFRMAKRNLYSLVHRASYSCECPGWLVHAGTDETWAEHDHVGFLVVDETVALPLTDNLAPQLPGRFPPQPYTALTVLYRASWG